MGVAVNFRMSGKILISAAPKTPRQLIIATAIVIVAHNFGSVFDSTKFSHDFALNKPYLSFARGVPTVCVTCVWAGVDSAWEQKKPEARKMLVNRADSHTSGARFVGRLI